MATVDIQGNLNNLPSGPRIQTNLGEIISNFVGVALIIGSVAVLFYMIVGGLNWISAGGDKGKIESAQQTITQAIIGLAVLMAAWSVFAIINWYFDLKIIG